jgi:uncharacterized protein (DUF1810 family)
MQRMADLQRFVGAQEGSFEDALGEIRGGRKLGHWMWFVFPQLAGLGRSETSRYYAIASLDEARAYLAHPLLGARLREAAVATLRAPQGRSAGAILGEIDAVKLRSSMTLFAMAAPDEPIFREVLERFFRGQPDPATERLLGSSS